VQLPSKTTRACERVAGRAAILAVLFGVAACGSRTAIEAPRGDPDAFVPLLDASSPDRDAGVEPDAAHEDMTPLERITITVTVGDDSLGDTDALRTDVSEAFVFVRLRDGELVEVGLNEGTTWSARSTHRRDIEIAPGATWSDVRAVGIRHVAAGNDWNADNWTMAEVMIASVSDGGRESVRYREAGAPVWQFRRNDHQVWEHVF
jgi:hypothetical protein